MVMAEYSYLLSRHEVQVLVHCMNQNFLWLRVKNNSWLTVCHRYAISMSKVYCLLLTVTLRRHWHANLPPTHYRYNFFFTETKISEI